MKKNIYNVIKTSNSRLLGIIKLEQQQKICSITSEVGTHLNWIQFQFQMTRLNFCILLLSFPGHCNQLTVTYDIIINLCEDT